MGSCRGSNPKPAARTLRPMSPLSVVLFILVAAIPAHSNEVFSLPYGVWVNQTLPFPDSPLLFRYTLTDLQTTLFVVTSTDAGDSSPPVYVCTTPEPCDADTHRAAIPANTARALALGATPAAGSRDVFLSVSGAGAPGWISIGVRADVAVQLDTGVPADASLAAGEDVLFAARVSTADNAFTHVLFAVSLTSGMGPLTACVAEDPAQEPPARCTDAALSMSLSPTLRAARALMVDIADVASVADGEYDVQLLVASEAEAETAAFTALVAGATFIEKPYDIWFNVSAAAPLFLAFDGNSNQELHLTFALTLDGAGGLPDDLSAAGADVAICNGFPALQLADAAAEGAVCATLAVEMQDTGESGEYLYVIEVESALFNYKDSATFYATVFPRAEVVGAKLEALLVNTTKIEFDTVTSFTTHDTYINNFFVEVTDSSFDNVSLAVQVAAATSQGLLMYSTAEVLVWTNTLDSFIWPGAGAVALAPRYVGPVYLTIFCFTEGYTDVSMRFNKMFLPSGLTPVGFPVLGGEPLLVEYNITDHYSLEDFQRYITVAVVPPNSDAFFSPRLPLCVAYNINDVFSSARADYVSNQGGIQVVTIDTYSIKYHTSLTTLPFFCYILPSAAVVAGSIVTLTADYFFPIQILEHEVVRALTITETARTDSGLAPLRLAANITQDTYISVTSCAGPASVYASFRTGEPGAGDHEYSAPADGVDTFGASALRIQFNETDVIIAANLIVAIEGAAGDTFEVFFTRGDPAELVPAAAERAVAASDWEKGYSLDLEFAACADVAAEGNVFYSAYAVEAALVTGCQAVTPCGLEALGIPLEFLAAPVEGNDGRVRCTVVLDGLPDDGDLVLNIVAARGAFRSAYEGLVFNMQTGPSGQESSRWWIAVVAVVVLIFVGGAVCFYVFVFRRKRAAYASVDKRAAREKLLEEAAV
eukprot:gnl/Chilomastix_cuspidata/1747.p1 GENE.gnl/Chilomastix_cuspidata/1747~~gnl/Chilomastix_cuspidata/1747.p1  ORF type:complete len:935 (-),score=326.32 gnl/Chilomastix_cuspidata/1747:157-2961(-)